VRTRRARTRKRRPARAELARPRTVSPRTAKVRREVTAIVLLLFAVFLGGALLLHGLALMRAGVTGVRESFGWVGENLAGPVTTFFGWPGAVLVTIAPAAHALRLFGWIGDRADRSWLVFLLGGATLLPIAFGLPLSGDPSARPLPGLWGELGAYYLEALGGTTGAWVIWVLLMSVLTAATLEWNPVRALIGKRLPVTGYRLPVTDARHSALLTEPTPEEMPALDASAVQGDHAISGNGDAPSLWSRISTRRKQTAREAALTRERPRSALIGGEDATPDAADDIPPIDLLALGKGRSAELNDDELRATGEKVVEALRTFRVESRLQDWKSGPVVTQFRIVPASGVKVRQIANLANDLALAMKAASIRIVAPVPGIGAVGVEVPNPHREIVALRDLFEMPEFKTAHAALPIALGKDLEGRPVVTDLAKMPHLLIAGATGAGKSVCINTIITSLLYKRTPRTLRLLLIDPKMVELSVYNSLPHLRRKVVTDNHDSASTLKWAVGVMEERYKLLAANGARNVQDFNRKVAEGAELKWPIDAATAYERSDHDGDALPYFVIVIDELSDLMMTVQGEVETPLAKLAQKARAIGIHLVLATQRPSVNVITGLIKANFPSRIAFHVTSQVDSRTIIDGVGAELLLGTGDMLFLPPGIPEPERLQGAFISSEETERLVNWYETRRVERLAGIAVAAEQITDGTAEDTLVDEDPVEVVRQREAMEGGGDGAGADIDDRDRLFRDAAEVVIQHQQGSTSLLQRRLKVGYGRAARIIDQLHAAGVLGPPDASKPREVLVGLDELERIAPR
jgi:S-DNA-T family DNA segregation ATPase FtsK/SpoIIIE